MTALGLHTVHELRNLWDAYSFELQALDKALADAWDTWSAADPAGFQQFNVDLANVSQAVSGFGDTVDRLVGATKLPGGTSEDLAPAVDPFDPWVDQFNALATAFAPFADLDRRFRTGPAASFAPSYVGIPQPDAPDLDLDAYQLTDQAMKVIEKVTSGGTGMALLIGAGVLLGLFIARR